MTTEEVLESFERCARAEYWYRDYEKEKWEDTRFLQEAIRRALLSTREDFGEMAGEEIIGLTRDIQIDIKTPNQWDTSIHLASLADILSCAVRKRGEAPWRVPEPVMVGNYRWRTGALLAPSGDKLRRIVLVSNWSDERHYHESRSWKSMGAICAYGLPMTMAVCVLGQKRDGKRHSHWSKAMAHPFNRHIRFRKKHQVASGFKETWRQIWREDDDKFSTDQWLQAMLNDGVLEDMCFPVDLPVPAPDMRRKVLDLAVRKLDMIEKTTELPDFQLTNCDWPLVCPFRGHCHKGEPPSRRYGVVLTSAPAQERS